MNTKQERVSCFEGFAGSVKLFVCTFETGCTDKEQATKVLEEAAEVFAAWQALDVEYARANDGKPYMPALRMHLGDEIADVITAACNLAARYGIDMEEAMLRCGERNHERGRC